MAGQSEQRVITALFIDVVGSTDLMMRVGPEVMRRRLVDAFNQMSARIAEHGGTVENYAGDAIFAIFGAPTAHIDDPERALRAARACADWSTDALGSERLGIRAGIETGEALIDLAAVERHERMAVGPCVNIAARLQQQADSGEIVVGPSCYGATAATAEFEELGQLQLKGFGAIDAWRFVKFASARAPQVPFVGRDDELQRLSTAADRAARGTPILALIVGEPGLGKSRLAEELIAQRRDAEAVRVITVRCRPAGEAGANTPLRQLIDADVADASPESVRKRLSGLLGATESEPVALALLHSTGIEASAELQATTRYEQRETIAEAWRRYLAAVAHERTLIISIEDLHWADPVLVRMIDHVTSEGEGPLLVVATARPEFSGSAHLRASEHLTQIDLRPLDGAAANALAEAAGGAIGGLERAAGNPLFIIELARARSAATRESEMPMTIQAAIAARLDELEPDERQLLQHTSVAGETFDVRDAALLADREPAEVAGMLGRIVHLGFVDVLEQGYRFHHALVRDVAYARLPVSTRLALHARHADAGVAPTDGVARAFHLWQATKPPDAEWAWEDGDRLDVLRRSAFQAQLAAGRELEARNQYEQAEEVYSRAVELAPELEKRAIALAELGRAMARQGKGDDAWENRLLALAAYAEAEVLAPARLYADMLEIATMNWGYFHELPPDTEVRRLLDDGLRRARDSDDNVSLARLLMERASFTDDPAGTDEVLEFLAGPDAVAFADAAHRTAQVLLESGQLARSIQLYKRVFDDLLPKGGVINEPEAMIWYGLAAFYEGDLALAASLEDSAYQDLAKGRSVHTHQHLLGLRSLVAFGRGDWDALLQSTIDLEELVARHPDVPFCLVGGAAVGYGGAGRLIVGQPAKELEVAAARMVAESRLVQASSIVLPKAMAGDNEAVDRGLLAYAPGVRLVDRASAWDVAHLMPAMAACVLERWEMLGEPLARLDHCAVGGSRLAAAAAIAIREERADAQDGGETPEHVDLRALGYHGISELLSYRAKVGAPA